MTPFLAMNGAHESDSAASEELREALRAPRTLTVTSAMITDDSRYVGQMDHIHAVRAKRVCAELQRDTSRGAALGVVADELIDVVDAISRGARGDEDRRNGSLDRGLFGRCPGPGEGHGEHTATI